MRKVTLEELKQLALNSKNSLWSKAKSVGNDVKLYLHWSAGRYAQFFDDYHISIDGNGNIYVSTDDFAEVKSHTWRRNTGAIGIALNCAYNATSKNLGKYAPTDLQIEAIAQTIAVLTNTLGLSINITNVMTHAEAADNMDGVYAHNPYGPENGCERWDLAIIKTGDPWMSGGNTLRGKAIYYQQYGVQ